MADYSEKEARVLEIFQHIASGYDAANDRISLGMQKSWKRMVTSHLAANTPQGARVLDACCGTGDISIATASLRSDLKITGLDFSPAMLQEARARTPEALRDRITYIQGDAMALPFANGSFAAAVISFGLRNTPDYAQVLREMDRVVKPGGCVYCIDSFVPQSPVIQPFYRVYFQGIMPLLGGGSAYRQDYQWLAQSTEEFVTPVQLQQLFRQAGIGLVRKKSKLFGACTLVWGRAGRLNNIKEEHYD